MVSIKRPFNSHYFLASNSWREEHNLCICVRLSTQEKRNHVVCLCIWFLLISANLLPVYLTHFLNCPPRDKDNFQTQHVCVLNEPSSKFDRKSVIYFFSNPLLTSLFCCSALWRCCVWVWTSSSSSSTHSGFAAGDARVMIPRTPIRTPSSPALTAAAPPGASSSPRSSAGERLSP